MEEYFQNPRGSIFHHRTNRHGGNKKYPFLPVLPGKKQNQQDTACAIDRRPWPMQNTPVKTKSSVSEPANPLIAPSIPVLPTANRRQPQYKTAA